MLLASGCASQPPGGDYLLDGARRSFQSGDYESALRYTELAIQRTPLDPHADEIALQLELLKAMNRSEEAAAFSEFVERFRSGVDTDAEATDPTREECWDLAHQRSKTTRLVREYAALPVRRPFELGELMATYQIDADGHPVHIRVIRARHPASAWLIIHAIGQMKVRTSRLAHIDRAEFPIAHCVYTVEDWPNGIWIPPRIQQAM